ncbi:MAG: tetratricopeptide repeat protein [Treponemataceae bacterium]
MKRVFIFFFFLIVSKTIFFATDYSQGISFLSERNYDKAIDFFLPFLLQEKIDPEVFMYVGVSYYHKGNFSEALQMFEKGLAIPFVDKSVFYFNAGNACFALGQFEAAEAYFTQAINSQSNHFSAYLNRGNTRIRLNKITDAFHDYEIYIKNSNNDQMNTQLRALIDSFYAEQERIAASLLVTGAIIDESIEEHIADMDAEMLENEDPLLEEPLDEESLENEESLQEEDSIDPADETENSVEESSIEQMVERIIERIIERTLKKVLEDPAEINEESDFDLESDVKNIQIPIDDFLELEQIEIPVEEIIESEPSL